MAKETLKKTAIAIAIALLAATTNMNAQEPAQDTTVIRASEYDVAKQTPEGIKEAEEFGKIFNANLSRAFMPQRADGSVKSALYTDTGKIVVGGGYKFFPEYGIPYATVGWTWDGRWLFPHWVEDEDGDLVNKPWRGLAIETNAFGGMSQYAATAYSAGHKYWTYGFEALLKVCLWEDKNLRHRINLNGGIGVAYSKHDTYVLTGRYQRINDDGSPYINSQGEYEYFVSPNKGADDLIIPMGGFGFFWNLGVSYSVRPFERRADRIEVFFKWSRATDPDYAKTHLVNVWEVGAKWNLPLNAYISKVPAKAKK